eukprot:126648-Prymnesium_polylepis.1
MPLSLAGKGVRGHVLMVRGTHSSTVLIRSDVTRASAMGCDPASAALLAGGCGARGGHACARRSIAT